MLGKYWYQQAGIYLCQKIIRTVEPHSKEDKQANRQKNTAKMGKKKKKRNKVIVKALILKRNITASTINMKLVEYLRVI